MYSTVRRARMTVCQRWDKYEAREGSGACFHLHFQITVETSLQWPPWSRINWSLYRGGHCREVSIRVTCMDRHTAETKNPDRYKELLHSFLFYKNVSFSSWGWTKTECSYFLGDFSLKTFLPHVLRLHGIEFHKKDSNVTMKMVLTFYVIETHVATIKNMHSSILSWFELLIDWDIWNVTFC